MSERTAAEPRREPGVLAELRSKAEGERVSGDRLQFCLTPRSPGGFEGLSGKVIVKCACCGYCLFISYLY